ncbi:hypothetical protein MBLNU230_g4943t1 [Neophaeotheca triangularis]
MAEQIPNGAVNGDTEMTEGSAQEAILDPSLQNDQTNLADPTDPQPPPEAAEPSIPPPAPEHLSTIAPAATEPPRVAQTPPAAPPTTTSRTGSAPPPPPQLAKPEKAVAHGGPTRQYLNTNVTPHLLEGMKALAMQEPDKPLLWLSEFLKERSQEVER